MDVRRLRTILDETTRPYRKGEAVTQRGGVVDIYAMPHESEANGEKVDCHFVVVGVDREAAERRRADLVEILRGYPQPERLAGGPSYIEVGAEIGDQGAALQLFALGQALGLWTVITPETLGITGRDADDLAGAGLVMMSGFPPAPVKADLHRARE